MNKTQILAAWLEAIWLVACALALGQAIQP